MASRTGFTVFAAGEVLQVDAWEQSGIQVPRSTLGTAVTETPGSALCEAGNSDPQIEIGDDRARMRNEDLIVEVVENHEDRFIRFPPLVRFLRADGEELLAESVPHFTSPAQRRYRRAGGDLFGCEVTFDAHPGERWTLRSAPARPAGPEGSGDRPRPAQHRGLGALRPLEPRLRNPVEHARRRPRRAWGEPVSKWASPTRRGQIDPAGCTAAPHRPTSSAAM